MLHVYVNAMSWVALFYTAQYVFVLREEVNRNRTLLTQAPVEGKPSRVGHTERVCVYCREYYRLHSQLRYG